jgi:hypothetical protein
MIINAAKSFSDFAGKAEQFLTARYPGHFEQGGIDRIHIGRNKDSTLTTTGGVGGFKITGPAARSNGNYLEVPDRMIASNLLVDPYTGNAQLEVRVADSVKHYISERTYTAMDKQGLTFEEAKRQVYDSIPFVGYYDVKSGHYVAEAVVRKVNDSVISDLQVPYWNVTYLNKVFKQPFLEGYAKRLVSTVGVPNIWADALSIWTMTFEGFARLANVAKTSVEFNINETVKNKTHQILSELVNLVVEYETSPQEALYGGLQGNPLTSVAIGERERYARLMLEQLHNALIYFGDPGSGFDGLAQLAPEIAWPDAPLEYIWADPANTTKGADAVEALNELLGDMLESVNYLPVSVRINVSPTAYKVLKWTMQSKVYNPKNPLTVLSDAFNSSEKIVGTMPTTAGDKIQQSYELLPDPMLAPGTPWNPGDTDLMFITFPAIQSSLDGAQDLIMAPVAIENYILPNVWPGRDGLLRTMLKRVGSLIAPVEDTVKIIRGFGVNPSYVP